MFTQKMHKNIYFLHISNKNYIKITKKTYILKPKYILPNMKHVILITPNCKHMSIFN